MRNCLTRVSLILLALSALVLATSYATRPHEVGRQPILIAHALGTIEGKTYTNSRESFRNAIDAGFKWFEVDLVETSDGEVVAYHNLETMQPDMGTDTHISQVSHATFMRMRHYGKFHPLDLDAVLDLIAQDRSLNLILDIKNSTDRRQQSDLHHEPASFSRIHKKISERLRSRADREMLLNQLVPQIYAPEEADQLRERFEPYSRLIFTTYRYSGSLSSIVSAAKRHPNIIAVALDRRKASPWAVRYFRQEGVPLLVFTVNDPKESEWMAYEGASGFYTDFLSPAQRFRTGPDR